MARVIPPRRIASLLLVVLCVAAPVLNPTVAGADPISDKRSQVEKVADQLEELQMNAEVVAEQFNDARLANSALELRVAAASARAEKAKAEMAKAKQEVADFAIRTYVHGDADALGDLAMLTERSPDAGKRRKYASAAIGSKEKVVAKFRAAKAGADAELADLREARKEAEAAEARVGAKKKAAQEAVAEQLIAYRRLDGELAVLVRAEQQRRDLLAGRNRPQSQDRGQSTEPDTQSPPPSEAPAGGGAASAIAAGKTQLGVPWVWAGSTPETGFDCSGFVLWAWAHGGKSLPHSSRAMYAMSTKISMSALQPGDLVFYGQPTIHHVALYMGGGQIIHSPGSGDRVRIDSVNYWDELAGAGRV